ncbi:BBSome-interacting protein 1 [Athalia rosae]|uniref:BBSome-interacting protein 1 n=1 Tax=Athalia rosae TaxID=37344 RepID=UPI00062690C0|nr:BBSome-interacting protein 1 [Athalia rosae]XP_012265586.1 BBSome-interacting protein 1 [Athalia rosae]XP_012265587.1 BBSome-interacting protein 1 [Athalia rosae]XP_012265588.1 BBSome-interacting protein 1 [Athalia rosae]XP_020711283.1 BBSome-interacting protein 1 [Athalia rosae]
MSEPVQSTSDQINAVIPQQGLLYDQEIPDYILCKPKLMPLKSITLEKLENMQKDAEQKITELKYTQVRSLSQEK